MKTTNDTKGDTKSRNKHTSPDGKWRSFPNVPNLLQYVSTGLYYARFKVNGKLIRRSIDASSFEQAKLKIGDFRRKVTDEPVITGTAGAALKKYLRSLNLNHTIVETTRDYYRNCVRALLESWPRFRHESIRKLTMEKISGDSYLADAAYLRLQEWVAEISEEVDEQYFNNILGRLRMILDIGGIPREKNPAYKIKRLGIELVPPTLPEPEQFLKLIGEMETSGAGQQQDCADFARFLAFSGCRLSEARAATFADVDMDKGLLTVHSAKTRRAKNYKPTRLVPIIPDMRELLTRLKDGRYPEHKICGVGECEKSLARACQIVGIPRLTHHDLRHLFATRCIEAGVDIPTVSRWLGHSDGGALAMRVFGHLREKHSAAMAQKVTFSQPKPKNVVKIRRAA